MLCSHFTEGQTVVHWMYHLSELKGQSKCHAGGGYTPRMCYRFICDLYEAFYEK